MIVYKKPFIKCKYTYGSCFITNVIFILMWFIIGFNTDNADYTLGYCVPYYDLSQNYFETGYRYLNILGRTCGLTFFQFRLILMTVMLLLLCNSIKKYARFPVFVTILYMIYPLLLQSVQIRNALAAAIVIYALRYLDENERCYKYLFFVFLAGSIHNISLIYFLLVFTRKKTVSFVFKISGCIFIFLYIIIIFFQNKILSLLYFLLKDERVYLYANLNEQHLFIKSMLPYIIVGGLLLYIFIVKKKRYIRLKNISSQDKTLLKASTLLLGFLPLFLIDGNYYRIWAFFLPVIYIAILNMNQYSGKLKNDKWIMRACCMTLAAGLFILDLSPYDPNGYEQVTKAVIQNNAILEWLK